MDMSGWSEGSEDKGEVCVRCEGVGGVGWGPHESSNPISHAATHNTCRVQMPHYTNTHTHTHTHTTQHTGKHTTLTNLLVAAVDICLCDDPCSH